MKLNYITQMVAVAAIAVTAAYSQTAAELMQKGIYTQETAGDLDGAITIYRQIVNAGSSPRDLAAQAQYRLAQSLLQKGDLGNAATEFGNLARNYADYGKLVSSMASMARGTLTVSGGTAFVPGRFNPAELDILRARLAEVAAATQQTSDPARMAELDRAKANMQMQLKELEAVRQKQGEAGLAIASPPDHELPSPFAAISFDGAAPVTMKGSVIEVELVNPTARIVIDPQDGSGKKYVFAMSSPRQLSLQGWTRQSANLGDQVTITGVLAKDGQTTSSGFFAALANTITAADGRKLFDRTAVGK